MARRMNTILDLLAGFTSFVVVENGKLCIVTVNAPR